MLRRVHRLALTLLAQGLASLTNFAVQFVALAAAAGDTGAFGVFAVAFAVCQVVVTIGEGSVATSVLVHGASDDDRGERVRNAGALMAVMLGVGLGVLIALAALMVDGDQRSALMWSALGAPALVAQYTLRSARFAQRRPGGVVLIDAVWFVVVAAAAAADLAGAIDLSALDYLLVWLVGAALSAMPAVPMVWAGRNDIGTFVSVAGVQTVRLGAESALARSAFAVPLIASSSMFGSEAGGTFAAAVLVFSPMTILHTTALAVVVPREVERYGIHKMSLRSVNLISLLLAAVTLLWAMMILGLDALNTGVEAFDLDLNGVTALIFWATAVRFVSLAGWRGPLTGLRVADATSASLQARAIATIGQWVIPVVMGIVWDLDGLVVGVAISAAIGAGLIWQSFYRLELPPKRQTPTGVITNAS